MTELNPDWRDGADCALPDVNPDIFFVEQGGDSRPARAICQLCDVRVECLQYALDAHERIGLYGGASERERRRIRKLGITAAEYIEGLDNGTYQTPKRGRPAQIGA